MRIFIGFHEPKKKERKKEKSKGKSERLNNNVYRIRTVKGMSDSMSRVRGKKTRLGRADCIGATLRII